MRTVRLGLGPIGLRRLAWALAALDVMFIVGMAIFIHFWAQIEHFGPRGRFFIRYVLVQFHLGTENVVAAWYSSMLLLGVAAAACLAYAVERRLPRVGLDRWLHIGWLVLAGIFALLSLDEVGSLHERIGMVVALNKASLAPSSHGPVGWVEMLAIPIAAVGLFMLAFGWARLRRVPSAFALLAVGVGLYLSDPFLEVIEGALVRSGSPALIVERILEEGVAELGGTLCILMGVLLYVLRVGGTPPYNWNLRARTMAVLFGAGGIVLTIGVPIAHWFVAHLPAGDTGIPDNWFPAAALALTALLLVALHGRRVIPAAVGCIVASAYFGAGLFVYAGWFRWFGQRVEVVDALATAAVTAGAIVLTLRHPREDSMTARRPAESPGDRVSRVRRVSP